MEPVARRAQTFKARRSVPPRSSAAQPSDRRPLGFVALLALVDLATRLAVPGALLALMLGFGDVAVAAAATVSALSIVRGLVAGRATERILVRSWHGLVTATRRRTVAALQVRPALHGVAALLEAVAQVVHHQSTLLPQALSSAAGLAITALVVLVRLGPRWLGLGVAVLLVVLPLALLLRRRLRADQQVVLDSFAEAAHGFEVLIDGATELRAHGAESRHAAGLRRQVRAMAAAERRVRTLSALTGLFPLGIALLVVAAPLRSEVEQLAAAWAPGRTAEVALLGATALVFGVGLLRALEGITRTGPHRRALDQFLAAPEPPRLEGSEPVRLRDAQVRFERLSVRYPGARDATPAGVDFSWPAGRGLAVTGPNGAGKSTLARCVVGLEQPTEGTLRFDGTPADAVDWSALRPSIVYVPQGAHIVPDRSVGWHLRLLGPDGLSDATMERALERVGLLPALSGHDGADSPLEVHASELSGGERQRMHLARTLLDDPALVVLDEPEAGLDGAGRAWLRRFVADLATRSRVLLVAHDPEVVPESFVELPCRRAAP